MPPAPAGYAWPGYKYESGTFLCTAPRREKPQLQLGQSSWGRACGLAPQEKDVEPPPLKGAAPPDEEGEMQQQRVLLEGLASTVDAQQRMARELHAELLTRLSDIEARIAQASEVMAQVASVEAVVHDEEHSADGEDREKVNTGESEKLGAHVIHCMTTGTVTQTHSELTKGWWRKSRSVARRIVRSQYFEVSMALLILASVLVSFVELEWEGYLAEVSLGLQEPGQWAGAGLAFALVGHLLNNVFFLEFLLRCLGGGHHYLRDPWAWFDATFVAVSVIDIYALGLGTGLAGREGQRFGIVRLVRCARMVRTFRAAGKIKAVRPLLLLVQTILGSMGALLWSTVFLFLVQLMGAIFVAKSLHSFITDPANSEEDRLWANRAFGSGVRSLYTFFEITFSGGWPNHVRPLMEKAGPGYAIFFVLYVAVWAFVIMRVIGALFIKETLAMAEKVESVRQDQEVERRKMMKKITDYFLRADMDQNGSLCWEELEYLFEDASVHSWFKSHNIDIEDARNLWMLLSSKGSLSTRDFVDGMLAIREPAKAIDLKAVLQTTRTLATSCEGIFEKVNAMELRMSSIEAGSRRRPTGNNVRTVNSESAASSPRIRLIEVGERLPSP